LGKHRDTQPEEQSTNPNPGGHGIYVCLSTFRREVIRQSCHMYIRGGGGCGKKQKMMEKMRKRKNKCKM